MKKVSFFTTFLILSSGLIAAQATETISTDCALLKGYKIAADTAAGMLETNLQTMSLDKLAELVGQTMTGGVFYVVMGANDISKFLKNDSLKKELKADVDSFNGVTDALFKGPYFERHEAADADVALKDFSKRVGDLVTAACGS